MDKPKLQSRYRSFEGWVEYYSHPSEATGTEMKFSVYVPPQVEKDQVPVVYWLSGLTCTEENFMVKSGAQKAAAEFGLMLVAPDTSPRGAGIAGEADHWDFGVGAGYYVNATQAPWAKHYRMEDYVVNELPRIIETHFPAIAGRQSISGHSMGGHGAMILGLRHPGKYQSISAFSPICAPSQCPWGKKAFTHFFGEDKLRWAEHDANELVKTARAKTPIVIDQGADDKFLAEQLLLETFTKTCREVNYPVESRVHPGYDHSYYFVSSFIGEHLAYHARKLHAPLI